MNHPQKAGDVSDVAVRHKVESYTVVDEEELFRFEDGLFHED